jgi:hypothetical protein
MTIVLNPPPILPLSPASAPLSNNAVAAFDARPFFDKALHYGVKQGVITPARLLLIQEDFAKGIVQIAHFFGTAHLRPELELALRRMANLISLYLEDMSDGDLQLAAISLRDKTFLSHSKGGSEMLKRLQTLPDSTLIDRSSTLPEQQRAYLDEKTAAATISLADYRTELAQRQDNRNTTEARHARRVARAIEDPPQIETRGGDHEQVDRDADHHLIGLVAQRRHGQHRRHHCTRHQRAGQSRPRIAAVVTPQRRAERTGQHHAFETERVDAHALRHHTAGGREQIGNRNANRLQQEGEQNHDTPFRASR